ncbi:hypothetical protein DIPPA_29540 [Diplonema papillatum]|nr:hypothetical protein DIPPA_00442 [Diplonema papillatum]KAJ9441861.1 hypothetical protein DIPPA_35083 [Diplonema papillatum]KAJ9448453.1 hypothetical protein DIPPA_10564 [Diplonema papillatum]KAJ9452032.1 hypothetical protein DIPPA_30738 [Diplonema papillatum]KAJ9456414.1 hypothetical protein DIPPA_21338 [Diplonema papillatum]
MSGVARFWEGRAEVLLSDSGETPRLDLLEDWDQASADKVWADIKEVAAAKWKEEASAPRLYKILRVVTFEAWAAGLRGEAAETFVKVTSHLGGLAYGSLLECAVNDGVHNVDAKLPPIFRSAAKKWYRCHEQREKEEAVRREDARAARPKDQPLRVLEVAQQLRRYGLEDLPAALKPSHVDLNAFQHRLERQDVALPFVDVAKPPFTPAEPGWVSSERKVLTSIQLVCALQRLFVIAGMAGAFGEEPLPVIFGYPALVADIAAQFGSSLARQYDEAVRRAFASVTKAVPGARVLEEARGRLLRLDDQTVMHLQMKLMAQSAKKPEARQPAAKKESNPPAWRDRQQHRGKGVVRPSAGAEGAPPAKRQNTTR